MPSSREHEVQADLQIRVQLLAANDCNPSIACGFTYTLSLFNDSLNTPQLQAAATRSLDASIHYVFTATSTTSRFGGKI